MAAYTSRALVLAEIPEPPATLTNAMVDQYIADQSTIVRGKLQALAAGAFADYPATDPYIERIVRFLAIYDCMAFVGIAERRLDAKDVPTTYCDRAEAMIEDIRSGRYQITTSTPKTITMAKTAADRMVTLDNQGYADGS